MNRYSLAADSRRWWWLPAAAGAVGTAAVASILVVSTTSATTPVEVPAPGPGGTAGSVIVVERPCYLARPEWNTPRGLEHPVCETVLGREDAPTRTGVLRPWLEYAP